MTRFRRKSTLQKFTSTHASVYNHFNHQRHLVSGVRFKAMRDASLRRFDDLEVVFGDSRRIEKYSSRSMVSIMVDQQDFQAHFTKVFQPVFMWGVAALELALVIYTFYMEFRTGTGPSLLYTILPLSIAIAIAWAVLSVLITLVIVGIKNRTNR